MMLTIVEAVLWLIRFFFGACVFSFLNVMIDRIPRGESVAGGRSPLYCMWKDSDTSGVDPVYQFPVSAGQMQRVRGTDPCT